MRQEEQDTRMSRLVLPKLFNSGNLQFVVREFKKQHLDELFQIIQKTKSTSKGMGTHEYNTKESLQKTLDACFSSLTLHDVQQNDKIFGLILSKPTPVARSVNPIATGGYFLLDPDYQGKQVQPLMWQISDRVSLDAGYSGVLGRFAVTARTPVPAYRQGFHFTGCIPQALYVSGTGWVFDLVAYKDLQPLMSQEEKLMLQSRMRTEPALTPNRNHVTDLLPGDGIVQSRSVELRSGMRIQVCGGGVEECVWVEGGVRTAAEGGEAFSLDEFSPTDGRFLHKLIIQPTVVIATDTRGNRVGAAICGLSALTRTTGAVYAAYVLVEAAHRGVGVGGALLACVGEVAAARGCDGLLLDVYVSNQRALGWLYGRGFIPCCTIPYSGYIKGTGFTHSMLLYKDINKAKL